MRRAPTLTALLLLTAQASAWGSSPKKEEATTSESPAAAEVCASPAAGAADGGLTSQVSQLTEALGAQATRIVQLERMQVNPDPNPNPSPNPDPNLEEGDGVLTLRGERVEGRLRACWG